MADALAPFPGFVLAPFTDAQHNGSSTLLDGVAHRGVGRLRILAFVAAPVILQVVHTPAGILQGILELMATTAGAPLTGVAACTGVESEEQSLGVNIISQCFHATGELGGIGHDVAH